MDKQEQFIEPQFYFRYPGMTYEDYIDIKQTLREYADIPEERKRLEKICSPRFKMLPVKERTKEYIYNLINGTHE